MNPLVLDAIENKDSISSSLQCCLFVVLKKLGERNASPLIEQLMEGALLCKNGFLP